MAYQYKNTTGFSQQLFNVLWKTCVYILISV